MHGLVSAFPGEGVTVDRVCQGGLLTNHGFGGINRTVEVEPGYREHRSVNPFHDLASIPQVVMNVPNVTISSWLRLWPPDGLVELLAGADLVLVEQPLQFPGMVDLAGDTPVVYSSHNVETERLASIRDRPLGGRVHDRLRAIERRAVQEAAGVVCTSEHDVETFRETFGGGPFHVAPNATYADRVADAPTTVADRGPLADQGVDPDPLVAAFVGSDYGPNVEGAENLFDVADTLRTRDVDVQLLLVGDVCERVGTTPPTVTKLGYVDDLASLLRACDVALNPITSGGGTNVKMLDYFAAGIPVVSTPFGAAGFGVEDGKHLLIREPGTFADALVELRDPDARERLASAALAYVREHHVWESVSADLLSWCREMVARGPGDRQ